MTVYFFYGQEEFLAKIEINKIKKKLIPIGIQEICVKKSENLNFEDLIQTISSLPLLFPQMLNIIDISNFLLGNKKQLSDNEFKLLEETLINVDEKNNVIFCCFSKDPTKKIDKRTKFFKLLFHKTNSTEFNEFRSFDKTFSSWIEKHAKSKDLIFKSNALSLFIKKIGVDLTKIDSELEKIKLIIYPEKVITQEVITNNCSSIDDVFALADFILKKDFQNSLIELKNLSEVKHPLEIIGALNSAFSKYTKLKISSSSMSKSEISLKFKMHEYLVQLNLEKLNSITLNELAQIKYKISEAEYEIKSGQSSDNNLTLEKMVLSV